MVCTSDLRLNSHAFEYWLNTLHTYMPMSPSSTISCQPKGNNAGKVTTGLASN